MKTSSQRSLFVWSTREILLIAAIGVVFGLILVSSLYAFSFAVALGPFAAWSWIGLYLMPSFFIGYILRRPGSALLTAVLYSLVMLLFSPYGPLILINCAFYAISGESAIAVGTRYRSFSLPWMILAGAAGSAVMIVLYLIFYPASLFEFALPIFIAVVAVTLASGIVSAIIAKLLADALARTGALAGTALKREDTQEV